MRSLLFERVIKPLDLRSETGAHEVAELAQEREKARREKNWKRSDELREQISVLGWEVRDTKEESKLTRRSGR